MGKENTFKEIIILKQLTNKIYCQLLQYKENKARVIINESFRKLGRQY